jgi:phosphonate degradation associated HDIG domain protein
MSETATIDEFINKIESLYSRWGTHNYDERISQIEHAVQCADHARRDNADDELIVATLLHDIGHLLELENQAGNVNLAKNDSHESTGASFLAQHFTSAVTAPIALHVEAKRFLCTTEATYFDTLSPASVRSLEIQGGKMSDSEAERFARHPARERSVALRRWDELGKDLEPSGLTFADFREHIRRCITR